MAAKITVKPKSWRLDDFEGRIVFSVETTELLTRENHTEILTKIGKMIANELENNELLKKPQP